MEMRKEKLKEAMKNNILERFFLFKAWRNLMNHKVQYRNVKINYYVTFIWNGFNCQMQY